MIIADLKAGGVRVVVFDEASKPVIEREVKEVTGVPLNAPYTMERINTIGAWDGCFKITCTFTP